MKKVLRDTMYIGGSGVLVGGLSSAVSGISPTTSTALGTLGSGIGTVGSVVMLGHTVRLSKKMLPKKIGMGY